MRTRAVTQFGGSWGCPTGVENGLEPLASGMASLHGRSGASNLVMLMKKQRLALHVTTNMVALLLLAPNMTELVLSALKPKFGYKGSFEPHAVRPLLDISRIANASITVTKVKSSGRLVVKRLHERGNPAQAQWVSSGCTRRKEKSVSRVLERTPRKIVNQKCLMFRRHGRNQRCEMMTFAGPAVMF